MTQVLLVIHVMLAIALVATVLLQRSEGGALGMGGGGMGGLMTGRATANLLSRTTAVLAACFMSTSLLLAYLGGIHGKPVSILDRPASSSAPVVPGPAAPSAPAPSSESGKEQPPAEKAPEVPVSK
jgi:preprotein translocase subunit SecG